jgi:hypothetical protein
MTYTRMATLLKYMMVSMFMVFPALSADAVKHCFGWHCCREWVGSGGKAWEGLMDADFRRVENLFLCRKVVPRGVRQKRRFWGHLALSLALLFDNKNMG